MDSRASSPARSHQIAVVPGFEDAERNLGTSCLLYRHLIHVRSELIFMAYEWFKAAYENPRGNYYSQSGIGLLA
jgi:hypothetical protein